MLESLMQYWYMWLVLAVLIVILIFVAGKASKAIKKKNEILAKQHDQMKRYSMLIEKYSELTKEKIESADAKELAEGVTAVLQFQVEKSENADAEYENAEKWRKEVYALFYFDEDVTADSLSFFFRNNGGPVPKEAVNGLESIGMNKIHSLAEAMFSMCDDKNENVSFDKNRVSELDEKFKNVYDRDMFFESVKNYIAENL